MKLCIDDADKNWMQLTVNSVTLYISYQTVVALRAIDPETGERVAVRLDAVSQTTARHLRKMGCENFDKIRFECFEKILDKF